MKNIITLLIFALINTSCVQPYRAYRIGSKGLAPDGYKSMKLKNGSILLQYYGTGMIEDSQLKTYWQKRANEKCRNNYSSSEEGTRYETPMTRTRPIYDPISNSYISYWPKQYRGNNITYRFYGGIITCNQK